MERTEIQTRLAGQHGSDQSKATIALLNEHIEDALNGAMSPELDEGTVKWQLGAYESLQIFKGELLEYYGSKRVNSSK